MSVKYFDSKSNEWKVFPGTTGAPGKDGKDGIAPLFKIEDGILKVSYDDGNNWQDLGNVVGEKGNDGKDGDSLFKSIDTSNNEYVVFTTSDDRTIAVPLVDEITNNKIYYTTTDKVKIYPNSLEPKVFGAMLKSNRYPEEEGILTFDDTVNKVGDNAFSENWTLSTINMPSSVKSIGTDAFMGCYSLKEINLPNTLEAIDYGAFRYCEGLTSIEIPASVSTIGYYAFTNCTSLGSVVFSEGSPLTHIGLHAFSNCSALSSIKIPDNVISINDYAFRYCTGLTSVEFNDKLESIGFGSFGVCWGLKEIILPESLKTIDEEAFFNGTFTNIIIPKNVESIGNKVFVRGGNNEPDLEKVYCYATTPPTLGSDVFKRIDGSITCKIYVPNESIHKYVYEWSEYKDYIYPIDHIDPGILVDAQFNNDGTATDKVKGYTITKEAKGNGGSLTVNNGVATFANSDNDNLSYYNIDLAQGDGALKTSMNNGFTIETIVASPNTNSDWAGAFGGEGFSLVRLAGYGYKWNINGWLPNGNWVYTDGTIAPEADKYYHVLYTYDATTGQVDVYRNGIHENKNADFNFVMRENSTLVIGARNDNGNIIQSWLGNMAAFRIYEECVIPTQAKELYESSKEYIDKLNDK